MDGWDKQMDRDKFEEYILSVATKPSEGLLSRSSDDGDYLVQWVGNDWDVWLSAKMERRRIGDTIDFNFPFKWFSECEVSATKDPGTIEIWDDMDDSNSECITVKQTTIKELVKDAINWHLNHVTLKITDPLGVTMARTLSAYLRDCAQLLDDSIDEQAENKIEKGGE